MSGFETPFSKLINEMQERVDDLRDKQAHQASDSVLPYRERRFGILVLEKTIERARELEKVFIDEPEEEND